MHLLCEDRLRELGVVQPGEGSEEAFMAFPYIEGAKTSGEGLFTRSCSTAQGTMVLN